MSASLHIGKAPHESQACLSRLPGIAPGCHQQPHLHAVQLVHGLLQLLRQCWLSQLPLFGHGLQLVAISAGEGIRFLRSGEACRPVLQANQNPQGVTACSGLAGTAGMSQVSLTGYAE